MSGGRKAEQAALLALQGELTELRLQHAETSRLQNEWQASAEELQREAERAQSEAVAIQNETSQAISDLRQQNADAIVELNRQRAILEADLATEQQKRASGEATNATISQTLQDRERQIERDQHARSREVQESDARILQGDIRLRDLEARRAADAVSSSAHIADLTRQLATTQDAAASRNLEFERNLTVVQQTAARQIGEVEQRLTENSAQAAARIAELEQRLTETSTQAATKITGLEQRLAESEIRSAGRAEQRSSLLRNLSEIHRLSEVSAKAEMSAESLKLVNPGSPDMVAPPTARSEAEPAAPAPYYSRVATWGEKSEIESA
jgi:hypothetical protein